MKSINNKSIPLLGLMGALLLATASPIASAHSESRTRIGVGLSLFFPHVGLHLGTSTSGRGHHHDEPHSHSEHDEGHGNHNRTHNGHDHHKGSQQGHSSHSSSTYEAPATRGGPRSKRRVHNKSASSHDDHARHRESAHNGKHKARYCDRPDADAARCLSEMQSGR